MTRNPYAEHDSEGTARSMTIIPEQLNITIHDNIRYAVHILRDGEKIGETSLTADQAEVRETLRTMQQAFPASVLVIQDPDYGDEWIPASDELLNRIARQKSAMALAQLVGKAPDGISWSLHSHRPDQLSGHADSHEALSEFAAWLKVEVSEERSARSLTLRASGPYFGVDVDVRSYASIPEQPAGGAL